MKRVLCIKANARPARATRERLKKVGFEVVLAATVEEGLQRLRDGQFALVLVDGRLPDGDGLQVVQAVAVPGPATVIMVTPDDVVLAVAAMRAGAAHYVVKDVDELYLELLPSVLDRIVTQQRLVTERQSAEQLAQITLQSIGDAVIATDQEGNITYVNPVAVQLTGWRLEEAAGKPVDAVFHIVHEESGTALPSPVHQAIRERCVHHCSSHSLLITRSGDTLPISDSAAPICDGAGQVVGAILIFQDASERRAFERNLSMFSRVFQDTSEAIVVTRPDSTIVDVNPAFCRITGYARDEVLGGTPALMKSGRHDADFYRQLWTELLATGRWQGEIWDRRKNGEAYPKWLSINAVRDRFGQTTHYIGIFSDITALKETEDRLYHLAHFDTLTGLPNRALFLDRLQQAMLRAERYQCRLALLFIDLDRFKFVNDSLGHQAGDQLLVQAAKRLRAEVRESDTVARLGGDEFTIILGDLADARDAARVAGKILEGFAEPFFIKDQAFFISPSIGISVYPDAAGDLESLVKVADTAMYDAKHTGRNKFVFAPNADADSVQRQKQLKWELAESLENGQLTVFFQPQISTRDECTRGMEALLRWQHSTRGLLLPQTILPLAMETGLMDSIGEFVLYEACHANLAWNRRRKMPLRVSVNVSASQLVSDTFPTMVARVLNEIGLDPTLLELEVAADDALANVELSARRLRRLKTLGVQIAIDRFGTGPISIAELQRLPIDTLKVDASFVQQVHLDGPEAAVSRAVIALARSLRLRVVAVGVESREQAEFLSRERCCDLQGFYFSPPVSAQGAQAFV
jgi:diguanylate cyclase (GGDEF)-like protein/PAS domain S-box-containing protein